MNCNYFVITLFYYICTIYTLTKFVLLLLHKTYLEDFNYESTHTRTLSHSFVAKQLQPCGHSLSINDGPDHLKFASYGPALPWNLVIVIHLRVTFIMLLCCVATCLVMPLNGISSMDLRELKKPPLQLWHNSKLSISVTGTVTHNQ